MKTLKIKYKSINKDICGYIEQYSQMFIYIYYNLDLFDDVDFKKTLKTKFPLMDSWFIQSCFVETKMLFEQNETNKKKKQKRIKEIEKDLKDNKITKNEKYKLKNKLSYLKRTINKQCTIGGKATQRKMVKQLNKNNKEEYNKLLNQFKQNRLRPIKSIGEMLKKGNRKFSFDLINNKIVFKPNMNEKIIIELFDYKNFKKDLERLQLEIDNNSLTITVGLDEQYIHITFDEECLNNHHFDKIQYFKDLKHVPKEYKEERKNVYIGFKRQQESRKLINKIENRYIAFDLNPEYIGFCILDKNSEDPNGDFTIVKKGYFDLSKYSKKLKLSSSHKKQIKLNNKKKYEIKQIWKHIFNLIKHYKVYNIVLEELEFDVDNKNSKESNRKNKNLWYRTLITNLINKNINQIGLNKIEIEPCYSSFVGNLVYTDFDPVSASIEIGRRGLIKYIKNNLFFPSVDSIKSDKLLFVRIENTSTIKELWKEYPALRDRNPKPNRFEDLEINLQSYKSKINYLIY